MTLKDAIEKELMSQGISAIDISKASGVSKATIYNILNGLTDDTRIRLSTKRAIARGCGREIRALSDGSVEFVDPGSEAEVPEPLPGASVWLRYASGRPFLSDGFCREAFDWVHGMETAGRIPACDVVNRVFQRRPDFLSLILENVGSAEITTVAFSLGVLIPKSRAQRTFLFSGIRSTPSLTSSEITLFLDRADFDFNVEVSQVVLRDADGNPCASDWEPRSTNAYKFRCSSTP